MPFPAAIPASRRKTTERKRATLHPPVAPLGVIVRQHPLLSGCFSSSLPLGQRPTRNAQQGPHAPEQDAAGQPSRAGRRAPGRDDATGASEATPHARRTDSAAPSGHKLLRGTPGAPRPHAPMQSLTLRHAVPHSSKWDVHETARRRPTQNRLHQIATHAACMAPRRRPGWRRCQDPDTVEGHAAATNCVAWVARPALPNVSP